MKARTILFALLFAFDLFIAGCLFTEIIEATGGAFPNTKMGATGPGVNATEFGGARRKKAVGETATDYVYPIEVYGRGECTQCHEPHASFGGQEPYPNNATGAATPAYFGSLAPYGTSDSAIFEGPDPYLLFADNNAVLCWTCHETFVLTQTGSSVSAGGALPQGYSSFGFYQGKPIYEASTHGDPALNTNMVWPSIAGADIHPRRSRLPFDSVTAQKGYCLNCHTPHGIIHPTGGNYDTTAVPVADQLAVNNQSVTTDGLIPRQLIAWEEALCFNCHDASGSATGAGLVDDIRDEIEKRSVDGNSGHPVDDITLAGEHHVGEELPILRKHVECYDCHNPHTDKPPTVGAAALGDGNAARIEGMRYIDIDGTEHDPVTGGVGPAGHVTNQPFIMELCFKCHGDSYNCVMPYQANGAALGTAQGNCADTAARPVKNRGVETGAGNNDQMGSSNKRFEFDTTTLHTTTHGMPANIANTAYHPVAAAGKNLSQQLCNQLSSAFGLDCSSVAASAASLGALTINCTDCHNNDETGADLAGTLVGVRGPVTESSLRTTDKVSTYVSTNSTPVGPHGSIHPRLLRGNYDTEISPQDDQGFDFAPAIARIPGDFALCFLCHNSGPFENADYLGAGEDWTNFHGNDPNEPEWGASLHWYHLSQEFNDGIYIKCHECHNNVHSNVEANNTQYTNGAGVGFTADGNTHLLNFGPNETPDQFAKPAWYWDTGPPPGDATGPVFRCNLFCHGIEMRTCSYLGKADGGPDGDGRCG